MKKIANSVRDLDVYKKAFEAAMEIFEFTKKFPNEEKFSLTDQIRRSSRAVCANLAEGWRKRRYKAVFINKLSDASQEAAETQTWLEFALACKYIEKNTFDQLNEKYEHIFAMLFTMERMADSFCGSHGTTDVRRPTSSRPHVLRPTSFVIITVIFSAMLAFATPAHAVTEFISAIRGNATISAISEGTNVVNVTLSATYPNNNLKAGQTIVVSGTTNYNGSFTISTVTDQTHFAYAQTSTSRGAESAGTAGGDYSLLSTWEANNEADLTAAATKVFPHGGITGAIADGASVTGASSGATGTVCHATGTQILIKSITGTFSSGEQVRVDVSNYVTISTVGDSARVTADCYNDWANGLNDLLTISGSTTDSTHYFKITAPVGERHTGGAGTGFKIDPVLYVPNFGAVINIQQSMTVVEWIELTGFRTQYAKTGTGVLMSSESVIRNSIVHDNGADPAESSTGISASSYARVYNNIVYNMGDSGIKADGASVSVYNNTVYNFNLDNQGAAGITNAQSGSAIRNNIVIAGATGGACFSFVAGTTNVNNISSDDTATGANSYTGKTLADLRFISTASSNMDLHIQSASTGFNLIDSFAMGKGANLSADANCPFTTDVDGHTRGAGATTWDIGADQAATEFVCAIRAAGKTSPAPDYNLISTWVTDMNGTDLTFNATRVFNGTKTGTVSKDGTVTLYRSGASQGIVGTVVHAGENQILVKKIRQGLTGTILWAPGSILAGTGTLFTTELSAGDYIYIGSTSSALLIKRIISDTSLEIADYLTGSYGLNGFYRARGDYAFQASDEWRVDASNKITLSATAPFGRTALAVAECYNDWPSGLPDSVDFGSGGQSNYITTDPSHYLKIRTPLSQRHNGTASSGFKLRSSGATTFYLRYIRNLWIDGLIVDANDGTGFSNEGYGPLPDYRSGYWKISNCIIYNVGNAISITKPIPAYIWNCIIYDTTSYGVYGDVSDTSSVKVYNTSIVRVAADTDVAYSGIRYATAKNCAVFHYGATSSHKDFLNLNANSTNNMSHDTSANVGSGNQISKTAANNFKVLTAGSEDLHLLTTADAVGTGTNLTNDAYLAFTTDINNNTRPATGNWSIGADSYTPVTWLTTAATTDWNTGSNWNTGSVPTADSDVVIPASCARYPILTANPSNTIKSLSVASGATLNLGTGGGGYTLTVNGNITLNSGCTFTAGDSTVLMSTVGPAATLSSGGKSFYNLTINSASATITSDGSVTCANNMTVTAGTFRTAQASDGAINVTGTLLVDTAGKIIVRYKSLTVPDSGGAGQMITAGNITVNAGGSLNADGFGFAAGAGPGGRPYRDGAHYGGLGGYETSVVGATYGSFNNPVSLGSGGGAAAGGGAIVLSSTGTVTVNGTLSANGLENASGSGSGGSINITAATLTGTGTIKANGGGTTTTSYCGGGGRIGLGNVTTDSFSGTLQANGGTWGSWGMNGFAGTIYLNSAKRANLVLGGSGNLTSLRLGTDSTPNSYDFGTITIQSGGTFEIDGNPSLNSGNGGAAVINATTVDVQSGGYFQADALGFRPRFGPGKSITLYDGGSHGGLGGDYNSDGTIGSIYDSLTIPVNLGSGGHSLNYGAGGGAIVLSVTGTLTVNGTLRANGFDATGHNTTGCGSGGSMNITANSLVGGGFIQANGGSASSGGNSGGGGGGRVALYYATSTYSSTPTAAGGTAGGSGSVPGAAGTVYIAGGATGTWSATAATSDWHTMSNWVGGVCPGVGTAVSIPSSTNAPVISLQDVTVASIALNSGGTLTLNGKNFTTTGSITINSGGTLAAGNNTVTYGGGFNASSGTFTGDGSTLKYNGGGTNNFYPGANTYNVFDAEGGGVSLMGATLNCANLKVGETYTGAIFYMQGTPTADINATGNITVFPSGRIFCYSSSTTGNGTGRTITAANIDIQANGKIYADGGGFAGGVNTSGSGPGGGIGASYHSGSGGGYGSAGGIAGGGNDFRRGGLAYGSATSPAALGSAGGGAGTGMTGGAGGGAIKLLVTGTLNVNGTLSASGLNGSGSTSDCGAGGGSGGSIWILGNCAITGSGTISANGGSAVTTGSGGGGGSGGRIDISGINKDTSAFFTTGGGTISVNGGSRGTAATAFTCDDGRAGTIKFPASFDLVVDNAGAAGVRNFSLGANVEGGDLTQADETLYNFNSVTVKANSVLTLSPNPQIYNIANGGSSGTPYGQGVTINAINIDVQTSGGNINSDAKGFWPYRASANAGYGVGCGFTADWNIASGAGYGAAGGSATSGGKTAASGAMYGVVLAPTAIGSSGGNSGYYSGAGGGAIKLNASGTLTINGTLSANGGVGSATYAAGGGSGGSVYLLAGTLAGTTGVISANGGNAVGNSYAGGGGGGRVAIYYTTSTYSGTATATGGTHVGSTANDGGSSTVYIAGSGTSTGTWTWNGSASTDWHTPANWTDPASGHSCPSTAATVSIPNVGAQPTISAADVTIASLTIASGRTLTLSGGKALTTTGGITINGALSSAGSASTITCGGVFDARNATAFTAGNSTLLLSGSNFYPNGSLTYNIVDAERGGGNGVNINTNLNCASLMVGQAFTTWTFVYLNGDVNCTGNIIVGPNGKLVCKYANLTDQVGGVTVGKGRTITAANIDIQPGGTLNADGCGFPGVTTSGGPLDGLGPGKGVKDGGNSASGAGYGGIGGAASSTAVGGPTYGTAASPVALGSSGACTVGSSTTATSGAGGGAIKLNVSGILTVNGILSANASTGYLTTGTYYHFGGSSGGSIWITGNGILQGTGSIQANGSNGASNASYNGGAGGGRIDISGIAASGNTFLTGGGTLSVAPGAATGNVKGTSGTAGTIKFPAGLDLIIDNAGNSGVKNLTLGVDVEPAGVDDTLYNFNSVWVKTGATLTLWGNSQVYNTANGGSSGTPYGQGVTITAATTFLVDGTVTANGKGFQGSGTSQTPHGPSGGTGNSTNTAGAGYGGKGGDSSSTTPVFIGGSPYGTQLTPTALGSAGYYTGAGSSQSGGGGIKLIVPGTLTINGTVSATSTGGSDYVYSGGAGGSIYFDVGTLAGAGAITANGSNGYFQNDGGGGGGRIAVYFSTSNSFTSLTEASNTSGGTGYGTGTLGSVGTVYIQGNGTGTWTWVGDAAGDTTNWHNRMNWHGPGGTTDHSCPGVGAAVSIPNVGGQPTISTADVTVASLTIASGRTLTLNKNLTTIGNITNNGTFTPNGNTITCGGNFNTSAGTAFNYSTSTLIMNGSGTPSINLGAKQLANVTFSGAGSYSFADANVTVNGNWTQSSGTVTAPSGTLTINYGGWNHIAGAFSHNNGNVIFSTPGYTTSYTYSVTVPTTETFNNLTFTAYRYGAIYNIASGNTLIVTGTYTESVTGTSVSNVYVNTGTIQAQGNVVMTDHILGSVRLNFVTAGDQTITADGSQVGSIYVAKPSGTVSVNGPGTLTSAGNFTLSSGSFNTASNNMTITYGDFILSGGAFTAPGTGKTLTLNFGNWNHTTGTFSHNNGSVVLGIPNYEVTSGYSITVPTTETFNNLTFANGNYGLYHYTIANNGTLTVLGNYSQSSTGTSYLSIDAGTIQAQGAVAMGPYIIGTAALTLSGTNDQVITVTGSTGLSGMLTVNKDAGTVTSSGVWTVPGAVTLTKGTLVLTNDTTFDGNVTVNSGGILSCTTPGKTMIFTNGTTVQVDSGGQFIMNGASGSLINLYNSSSATKWNMKMNGYYNIDYVNVKYSDASTGSKIYATNSQEAVASSTTSWDFATSAVTWNGGTSTDWMNSANWTPPIVPGSGYAVTIPTSGVASNPTLGIPTTIRSLSMQPGRALTCSNGANLTVVDDINCAGTVKLNNSTLTGGGNITFSGLLQEDTSAMVMNAGSGSKTLTLPSGDTNVYNLSFTGAGTFGFGNANVAVTGGWTQTAGIVNAPSGTLTMNHGSSPGSFTHTAGGTFNAGTGTVTFAGRYPNIDVATQETFNNITLDTGELGASFGLTIASGDTLIVNGTTTLNNGIMDGGTVDAKGAISVSTTFKGGTGALLIDGAGNQSFTIPSGAILPAMTLNSAATTVGFSAGANATIGGLILQAGIFNAPTGTLTLSRGTASGAIFSHPAGGTFNAGTGTVVLGGRYPTVDVATQEIFNNLTLATEAGFNLSIAGVLISNGTLTLTDGTANTGTLNAKGAVGVANTFDGGTAALQFTGTGDQALTIASGAVMPTGAVTVNKTGGTVNVSGPWTVGGAVTITAGGFSSASAMTFGNTVTITSGAITTGAATTFSNNVIINAGTLTLGDDTIFSNAVNVNSGGMLSCNAGGKTVTFTGGKTYTVASGGQFTMKGSSGNLLTLARGGSNSWDLVMNGAYDIDYVTVGYSTAAGTGQPINATNSSDATGSSCINWVFNNNSFTWNGNTSTDWMTATNWTPNGLPSSATDVIIPATGTKPTLSQNTTIKSLNISQAGAQLTLNGDLTVLGDITNVGTLLPQTRTIRCGGNFNTGTGTFTIGTSTINMNAASGTKTLTLHNTAKACYNLTFSGAGEFNFGNTDLTINGAFTMGASCGTVNLPTGTVTSSGNWTVSGGTLNPGTGTVQFGTWAGTQAITGSHELYNVSFIYNSGTFNINPTTTLTTNGTLRFTIPTTDHYLKINTGTIVAKGDVIINGVSGILSGTATIRFSGTAAQAFTSTIASRISNNIEINKPSGVLTLSGTIGAYGNWTYVAAGGTINPGTSTVQFGTWGLTQAITGSHELYNVSFVYHQGTINIASGTILTVNGSLEFMNDLTGDIVINTGTINAKGNVNVATVYNHTGSAALQLTGAANQAFTNSGSSTSFQLATTINKPSGTVTKSGAGGFYKPVTLTAGTLSLADSTTFSDNVTVASGGTLSCATPGKTITVASGKTIEVNSGGTINMQGADGSLINLTGSAAWIMKVLSGATYLFDFVRPTYSNAATSYQTLLATNSTSGGNNTNWNIVPSLQLSTWDLNMNAGTLALHFNSAVDTATFDPTGLTLQDAATAGTSYTLTNSTTASPNGADIIVTLSAADLNAVKVNESLAKSSSNSYLRMSASTIKAPTANGAKPVLPIADGSAMVATSYTADTTAPMLSNWSLDMNAHTMTLNFSESVKGSAWTPSAVTLQSTSGGGTTYPLTAGSTTASANGTQIIVTLSIADFNNIFDISGGGLCDTQGHSYLTMTSSAMTDMAAAPNSLTAVSTGMNASSFNANSGTTAHFRILTSTLANSTSMTAGTTKAVILRSLDANGYRTKLYNGDKTLIFSGAASSRDPVTPPTAQDKASTDIGFGTNTTVVFNSIGAGTSTLTLYKRESALIKAAEGGSVSTLNADALTVQVNPELKTKVYFSQEPSATGTINLALGQQPKVKICDTYGNQTDDTDVIKLYASSRNDYYQDPGSGAALSSDHTDNKIAAVAGEAVFSGVKYNTLGTIYLYAEKDGGGLTEAFSNTVVFSTTASTSVDAAASPVADLNLTPTNDTLAEKFSVLKFKITDQGGDSTPTLVDRIRIAIGGTGANASTDIAWAELRSAYGGDHQVAIGAIANDFITFGSAPNANSLAALDSVPDGVTVTYTVNIYMKNSKLTAAEDNTYTFGVNETLVDADGGTSSQIAGNSSGVSTVTGTIVVDMTHFYVVNQASGNPSGTPTAGTPYELQIRTTDSNKNIDKHFNGNKTLVFSGLANFAPIYYPKIETTNFGVNTTVSFSSGVSASNAVSLTAVKAETADISVAQFGASPAWSVYPFTATTAAAPAAAIALTSGNNQAGKTSGALPTPMVVTVTDTYGNTVPATNVSFAVSSRPGGATGDSVNPASTSTNSSGQASTTLTIGNTAGTYQVQATSAGLSGSPVTFTATGRAVDHITKVSGDGQSKTANLALDADFVARLADVSENPVPNESITFTITTVPSASTGSQLQNSQSSYTTTTDSNGLATCRLTLGNKAGSYIVQASSNGKTADFSGTATAGTPYKVIFASSSPSSVNAGQPSSAFIIQIQDQNSNVSTVSQDTTFNLSASLGTFYSDAGCTAGNEITQKTVSSGQFQASFYFKSAQTGNTTVQVARASGQSLNTSTATRPFSVLPGNMSYFTVTGDTSVMTTGDSRSITVTAYDSLNNIVTTYSSALTVRFSGANSSPSGQAPTCSNNASADIAFASDTALTFSSGAATTTLKLYKAEATAIKASSGSVLTSDPNALAITVKHGAADHTKLTNNLPTPQVAGTAFTFDTTLDVTDKYDNVCNGANGGPSYDGSKAINWSLSGIANSPNGNSNDIFVSPVVFAAGRSTTALGATLYRAQSTTISADIAALPKTASNVASNSIAVAAGAINQLFLSQNPSVSAITSHVLASQPWVAVADQYGNPCTSANAQIKLRASTTTGSLTDAVNGTLTTTNGGQTNTLSLTNGVAKFTGLTYSYPETIYLQASVVGYVLDPIYSLGIAFLSTQDLSVIAVTDNLSSTVSSVANTSGQKVSVYAFKITDAGSDGIDGLLKKIVIKREAQDTKNWMSYLNAAYLSDGSSEQVGSISADKITFGDGTSTVFSVANNTNVTYTLKITLKNPLPAAADGEILRFTMDASSDITLDPNLGSSWSATSAVDRNATISVIATTFWITGSSSMPAGGSNSITLKGVDANRNIDKEYTGSRSLTFSGATALDGYPPTCAIGGGGDVNFGDAVNVPFASGSATLAMKLYKSEVAVIAAADNNMYSGNTVSTVTANKLTVAVSSGTATKLIWNTQPAARIVKDAPWREFVVGITDEYGNTASSTTDVTVTPTGAAAGDDAVTTVAAVAGLAHFTNFFVKDTGVVTLVATASGFTATNPSDQVVVEASYTITINAKDSVSAAQLTNVTMTITDSDGHVVYPATKANSPFSLVLPYGVYSIQLDKEAYVTTTAEKTAGYEDDGADGTNDNVITWNVLVMSVEESQADYKVQSSFVYDEDLERLTIRLWLERRGKLVLNDVTNKLGTAIVNVYDDVSAAWLVPVTIAPPGPADTSTGTLMKNIENVLIDSNDLGKALVSGKTYFARCTMRYGGVLGTNASYESGTTFTITVTQKLSKDIIAKIGVPEGQTLGGMITAVGTAVTSTAAKVDTVNTKIDTMSGKVDTMSTQVATVHNEVGVIAPQVTAILGDTGAVIPALITQTAEKGVLSEILTRNTVIREDETIKIRYRTAVGLAPTMTIYNAAGTVLSDYDGVTMTEIGSTGIYEYAVTAKKAWGAGDFTVVCREATKGSKDSMVLSVRSLYVASGDIVESLDAIGYAVSSVYERAGTISDIIGSVNDTRHAGTVFGAVNNVDVTIAGLALGTVASDARLARKHTTSIDKAMKSFKSDIANVQSQYASIRKMNDYLEDLRKDMQKVSKGIAENADAVNEKKKEAVKPKKDSKEEPSTQEQVRGVNNKIEELNAMIKVVRRLVEDSSNKPVVEGWYEAV